MIVGIGTDIAEIARFLSWAGNRGLTERFFHSDECAALERIPSGGQAARFLAGRFAAKEAFSKALGTGFRGVALREICVLGAPNGRPALSLFGSAREALSRSGAAKVHVSLSHDGGLAIAFVVLES
jgi:holo-[acyl-carrier protein] synthase